MFRWMRVSLVTVLVLFSATIALACGGLFLTEEEQKLYDIAQHGERIIFTVNGNNSYTAILGIDYVGSAKEFSWIMPVPSVPEVDVVDGSVLDNLQYATNMHFTEPDNPCSNVLFIDGLGGGGDYVERGQTGPYEFAIIKNDSPDELLKWLTDNGYVVNDAGKAMIDAYVKDGAYFVAMKLRQDAEVGDIQPVRLKYTADKLQMAMRMTSIAAVPQMALNVWIFADTQYVPENFAHPAIDYTTFKGANSLTYLGIPYRGAEDEYQSHFDALQAQYNGQMFVTEYAGPTDKLDLNTIEGLQGSLIEEYAHQFKYLTRLHGQMAPEQMTLDPIFAPDPNAADVSPNVNLGDYHDPLHYWQCSTRGMAVDTTPLPQIYDLPAIVPEYAALIGPVSIKVAVPEGWQMSAITVTPESSTTGDVTGYIFAPEKVTADTIKAYARGEPTPPMFVVAPNDDYGFTGSFSPYLGAIAPSPFGEYWDSVRGDWTGYAAILPGYALPTFWSTVFLTTPDDWDANKATYQAMQRYMQSYQYYLSADLRHTLFLGQYTSIDFPPAEYTIGRWPLSYIAFPEGWTEHLVNNNQVTLTPDGAGDNGPRVWLRQTRVVYLENPASPGTLDEAGGAAALRAEYGLSADTALEPYDSCTEAKNPIFPFNHNGRQGYLLVTGEYVFEASAPAAQFAENDATLKAMLDTVPIFGLC